MLSVIGIFAAAVSAQAATATPAKAEEKLVCKRVEEDSTGSRLGKMRRICRTQAQWRAMDDETSRAIGRSKNQGLVDPESLPKGR